MASNSFGSIFKITTFGESHGKLMGVVIDGCPAGINITEDEVNQELSLRAPGKNNYTSPRKEQDIANIVSGVFENITTGAPVTILINNHDHDSSKYKDIKNLLRPGHANYTYLEKYGIFDYNGGGRSSARETAARVAAGVIAKKILDKYDIKILSYLKSVGNIFTDQNIVYDKHDQIYSSDIFCYDQVAEARIKNLIEQLKLDGDSVGASIGYNIYNSPVGLGEPIYDKLEARLAYAMLSIPASKGFEIGSGFAAAAMHGSEHNDEFINDNNKISFKSNNAGGVLGGISNGDTIYGTVAFKPTSSIKKTQNTLDLQGEKTEFKLPEGSRHDPCVAIRAVPIVTAMCRLVMADFILMNKTAKI